MKTRLKKIGLIWVDKEQYVPKQEGSITLDPIDQLKFELFDGNNNPPWGWLVSKHPDQAINYPYLGTWPLPITRWVIVPVFQTITLK